MDERRRRILAHVDPATQTGLEIGPLSRPIVERGMGRVLYADRLSSDDLRSQYGWHVEHGHLDLSNLVEVDIVVPPATRLAAALGEAGPVDYVVASHVIEHVPDPIGWLAEIAECLRDGGLVCLAVPDKRFTFDHFRDPTTIRELLGWFAAGPALPTPAQVYDHVSGLADVDAAALWRGRGGAASQGHSGEEAWGMAEAAGGGQFHDVHCSVFTPASFCDVLRETVELGLCPFECMSVDAPGHDWTEFFVTLRKRSTGTPAERAATVPALDRALHHDLPARVAEAPPPRWAWSWSRGLRRPA